MVRAEDQSSISDAMIREAERAYYKDLSLFGFNSGEAFASRMRVAELERRRRASQIARVR